MFTPQAAFWFVPLLWDSCCAGLQLLNTTAKEQTLFSSLHSRQKTKCSCAFKSRYYHSTGKVIMSYALMERPTERRLFLWLPHGLFVQCLLRGQAVLQLNKWDPTLSTSSRWKKYMCLQPGFEVTVSLRLHFTDWVTDVLMLFKVDPAEAECGVVCSQAKVHNIWSCFMSLWKESASERLGEAVTEGALGNFQSVLGFLLHE